MPLASCDFTCPYVVSRWEGAGEGLIGARGPLGWQSSVACLYASPPCPLPEVSVPLVLAALFWTEHPSAVPWREGLEGGAALGFSLLSIQGGGLGKKGSGTSG